MITKIIKRIIRQPLSCVAVCLFAAVLSFSLCYLHASLEEELKSYEQTRDSIPVHFRITDLDGSGIKNNQVIEGWAISLFNNLDLAEFSKDVQIRTESPGKAESIDGTNAEHSLKIIGITTLGAAEELTPEYGGNVRWYEGFDESILETNQYVCLVPEDFDSGDVVLLTMAGAGRRTTANGDTTIGQYKQITQKFTVVGRYTDEGNNNIYCPYNTAASLFVKIGGIKPIRYLKATLNDNSKIDQFREASAKWFAEPNPSGTKTPWGKMGFDYYLYALDIDDDLLQVVETNMKNSIYLNKFASVIVFILSAGAGFLTGFLIIRARKREIALMRTIGNSQISIFGEFSLEQLACVVAGIILGGGYSLWQPIGQLLIFGCIFYLGLAVALAVFLNKNLLTTIKEDE